MGGRAACAGAAQAPAAEKALATVGGQTKRAPSGIKRLSYAERREWEQMETMILAAEQDLAACHAAAHDPSVAANAVVLQQRYDALREAQKHVDGLYARWAELEEASAAVTRGAQGGRG